MRKYLLLSLVVLLALAMAAPVSATQGNPEKELPFKGVFSGEFLGFNEDAEDIAERCDDPATTWAVTSFKGWGTATHMGNSYVYAEHCSYTTNGTYGEGELTVVAANGDILYGTYTGGVSLSGPPIVGFMDSFSFVDGGTGRFAVASGGGIEEGSVDFTDTGMAPGAPFTVRMEGVISYHASR
jgi:hypothetical protein